MINLFVSIVYFYREEEILNSLASQCQPVEGLKKAFRTNSDAR